MRGAVRFLAAAVASFLLVAGVLYLRRHSFSPDQPVAQRPAPAPAVPRAPPVLATLPEFVLEDQEGRSYDLYDLRGRVWVASFVYSRCGEPCEPRIKSLVRLAADVAAQPWGRNVRFVSLTADPDHDSTHVLAYFAQQHGLDLARWKLLRGTAGAMREILEGGFKLRLDGSDAPGTPLLQGRQIVAVDRSGRVRGTWDALDPATGPAVLEALAALEAEPEPNDLYVPFNVNSPPWLGPQLAEQINGAQKITADHDFRFTDQIGASGITFRHVSSRDAGKDYQPGPWEHGSAVAVADVDGDGLPDLYFVNQAGSSALYRNLGRGHFEDITDRARVGTRGRTCTGAAFADIDNDGRPDLFVTCVRDGNLLFHNEGSGVFKDISASAGVENLRRHPGGAVFFDFDGDGLLDLFVTGIGRYTAEEKRPDGTWVGLPDAFEGHLKPERAERSTLYRNVDGTHFQDVTESSGLVHTGWSGEATALDYDGDGRPDLLVLSMQGEDVLWHNLGHGRFERARKQALSRTPWGAMGAKVLDWNGDGRPDILVTDLNTDLADELRPEDEKKKRSPATMFPQSFLGTNGSHVLGNALFTNLGRGEFREESDSANVETGWPFGPSAGDLNADGYPDLVVPAGMGYPFRYHGTNVLLNLGGNRFADAQFVLGVEPRGRLMRPWFELDCDGADAQHELCRGAGAPLGGEAPPPSLIRRHGLQTVWAARSSRSAAIVDLDGDGDLDIVTNNQNDVPQVLMSDLAQKRHLNAVTVRLQGKRSNRDGIGATVTLTAEGRSQVQWNDGKSGYLAQSVLPLYFGLGHPDHADAVQVTWPSGRIQRLKGPIPAGAHLVIQEP